MRIESMTRCITSKCTTANKIARSLHPLAVLIPGLLPTTFNVTGVLQPGELRARVQAITALVGFPVDHVKVTTTPGSNALSVMVHQGVWVYRDSPPERGWRPVLRLFADI